MKINKKAVLAVCLLFLLPFVTVISGGFVARQSLLGAFEMAFSNAGIFFLEYLLIMALFAAFTALTGKFWAGHLIVAMPFNLLHTVSFYKTLINGMPLLLGDLSFAKELGEIAAFALPQISVSAFTISAFAVNIALSVALVFVERKKKFTLKTRLIAGGCAILAILFAAILPIYTGGNMSEEERAFEYGAPISLYTAYAREKQLGRIYTDEALEKLNSEKSAEVTPEPTGEEPTVIFLMSESFFDVTKLGIEFENDPLPNFRRLAKEFSSGGFISSAYCGGTGYVEMEVLTGICSNLLKESDTLTSLSPRSRYTKIPAITDIFKKYGYSTYFLHAYNSELYNRDVIYDAFGFDEVLFDDSFPERARHSGGYIADDALAEKIIELYENKGDSPLFLYAVTMENHQPYLHNKFGNIKMTFEQGELSDKAAKALNNFANGIADADYALGLLVEYFEKREEPVMLVFFGDHMPNLINGSGGTVYSELGYVSSANTKQWEPKELKKMLTTDWLIWTNYETEVKDGAQSSTFLGIDVMERLGFEYGGYHAWVRDRIMPELLMYRARLFADEKGKARKDVPEEKKKLISDWQVAVYDIVYGRNCVFSAER